MSRPLKNVYGAALRAISALLWALGMGMPQLCAANLSFLLPRYILLCSALSVFFGVLSLRKKLLGWAVFVFFISQAAMFLFGAGFLHDSVAVVQILALAFSKVSPALALYSNVLCVQLAVYLSLLAYVVSTPDCDSFSPFFIFLLLLTEVSVLGIQQYALYMLPVLPALALHYAFSHSYEKVSEVHTPRTLTPLALPIALVFCLLALLIAPEEGTVHPKMAEAAQNIKNYIDDHLFFTEERARYTLASDGWMPMGNSQLGGKVSPNDHKVMRVETSETAYLRGTVLDTYTGGAWYDSIGDTRRGWEAAHNKSLRAKLFEMDYPLLSAQEEKQLTVTMLTGSASTVFVPQRMRALSLGENMVGYFNDSTEIFITRNLQPNDTYAVRYLPMKATDAGMAMLVKANAYAPDPQYAQMRELYTRLPSHIQKEIFDIAALATRGCTTPWEKAVALRDYLKTHYDYSLDVQTPPQSVDFAAWFLLAEKKGYCTYFATAMTVLCRIAGLPARYIEGYVARPDGSGIATVTGKNAHAWTEVYLNGVGWITFDATAAVDEPDRSNENTPPQSGFQTPTPPPPQSQPPTPTPEPPVQDEQTPTPEPENEPPEATPTPEPEQTPPPADSEPPLPWLLLLLLIALILLLAWRIRSTHPMLRAQKASTDTQAFLILWYASLLCMGILRCAPLPAETPLQFAARAERTLGMHMTEAAETVSSIRYGRHSVRKEMSDSMKDIYQALEERLNLWQKLRLSVKRALRFR
ncbi:MAG: transglutaminase domain-containing protein [Clostridia bacterium]|nr:transglutaminase domain-containing protein [Clostridia bacterium]